MRERVINSSIGGKNSHMGQWNRIKSICPEINLSSQYYYMIKEPGPYTGERRTFLTNDAGKTTWLLLRE